MTNTQYPEATTIEFGGRTIPVIEGSTVEATLSLLGVPAGANVEYSPITKVVTVGVKAGSKGAIDNPFEDEDTREDESELEVDNAYEREDGETTWALPTHNLSHNQITFIKQKEVDVTDAQALLNALQDYKNEAQQFAKTYAEQFLAEEITANELVQKLLVLDLA